MIFFIHPNEKIRNVINDIESKDRIQIIFAEPKVDPIVVEADKIRIYEVISNLLTNGIKFTKKSISDDGSSVGQAKGCPITIFTDIKSNQAQDKLFLKFVTKSERGSELGLYISKGIIEAHGGRIWAENNADSKEATFAFSLPIKYE